MIAVVPWLRKGGGVLFSFMHFTWEQHQKLSRNVAKAADKDMGLAITLRGVGLMLLSKDLLLLEQQQPHSNINNKGYR